MTIAPDKYNVGGVKMARPFKLRRLGHFGFNCIKIEESRRFYSDLLGFRISDEAAGGGAFMRYGTDHHAFVLFNKEMIDANAKAGRNAKHWRPENDINQITWQVQSLQEIWDATKYFEDLEMDIRMSGRGGTGSNYHLYVYDPDDQIDELYYGIEQIGWNGFAKPKTMHHGMPEATYEPHVSELDEVQGDMDSGLDVISGYRGIEAMAAKYDVNSIMLPRPFKITKIGPVNLFVDDLAASKEYYQEVMGFTLTEEATYNGAKASFLRCNTEHHSLGLYEKSLRSTLGLSAHTSSASFGIQLANYEQLKNAVSFLRENGVRVETDVFPPELHPGIDYAAYAFDPDGHCIELYCYMEQLGWDGQPRPAALRPKVDANNWPETVEERSDTYAGETFMGPWG